MGLGLWDIFQFVIGKVFLDELPTVLSGVGKDAVQDMTARGFSVVVGDTKRSHVVPEGSVFILDGTDGGSKGDLGLKHFRVFTRPFPRRKLVEIDFVPLE